MRTQMEPSQPSLRVVSHPLIEVRLTRLRDRTTPFPEFRRTLRELTTLLGFEATREFATTPAAVETPLAPFVGKALKKPVVIVPILRAGLGMTEPLLELLPEAAVGHIGLYRDEVTLEPHRYYCRQPAHLANASVLLVDPMLATGHSAVEAVRQLKELGASDILFLCILSCPEGIRCFSTAHPDVPIFTAAIDERLNEKGYILPGLGDAGDRVFGTLD